MTTKEIRESIQTLRDYIDAADPDDPMLNLIADLVLALCEKVDLGEHQHD